MTSESVPKVNFLPLSDQDFVKQSWRVETILGTKLDSQQGKNADYIKITASLYDVLYRRLIKPWLHPDIIYKYTPGKKDQDYIVKFSRNVTKNVISKAWSRVYNRNKVENQDNIPLIDQIVEIIKTNPECMNEEDFLYHMFTLYLASEDTITIIISILCVCFGMYPDYQKKAAEEIYNVLGKNPKEITYEDISKMEYLDMCVKDALRLMPIAPFILRKTLEDFTIDKWVIPKDCCILISIFDVHRDPEHWENPNHFHPDHFLPESVRKRHPFAFVPFSAGSRGCVGKVLANVCVKLFIANILQRFEIEADGKFPDLVLKADISVRCKTGYEVRLKKREWI